MDTATSNQKITRHFLSPSNPMKLLLGVLAIALVAGIFTGYNMAKNSSTSPLQAVGVAPKAASQDTQTFRDFAEGVIKAKPEPSDPSEYIEGTHTLIREDADPVALTSSVVDLSLYEGKKVKVLGETQKALKVGWLMDVGKVEETQ